MGLGCLVGTVRNIMEKKLVEYRMGTYVANYCCCCRCIELVRGEEGLSIGSVHNLQER